MKKLDQMKNFFMNIDGSWDRIELISELANETGLLKEDGYDLSIDEVSLESDDYICTLDEFLDEYTDRLLEKVVNVIESFEEE